MTLYKLFCWEPDGTLPVFGYPFGHYRLVLTTSHWGKVQQKMAQMELSGQTYRLVSRRVERLMRCA